MNYLSAVKAEEASGVVTGSNPAKGKTSTPSIIPKQSVTNIYIPQGLSKYSKSRKTRIKVSNNQLYQNRTNKSKFKGNCRSGSKYLRLQ